MFEIGQWVSCEEGIGQVLYVRNQYAEEFYSEAVDKNLKKGEVLKQFLVIKIFLNHKGKPKKGKRIVFNQSKYCNILTLD